MGLLGIVCNVCCFEDELDIKKPYPYKAYTIVDLPKNVNPHSYIHTAAFTIKIVPFIRLHSMLPVYLVYTDCKFSCWLDEIVCHKKRSHYFYCGRKLTSS